MELMAEDRIRRTNSKVMLRSLHPLFSEILTSRLPSLRPGLNLRRNYCLLYPILPAIGGTYINYCWREDQDWGESEGFLGLRR